MQLSKIKLIVIVFMIIVFTSAVYADSNEGWKGYGLYNLNGSKITIASEDIKIGLLNEKFGYTGEFLIRNQTGNAVKAVLGMPAQGIESILITEKDNNIKWKKRSFGSLQSEFNLDSQVPQEDFWYVFSVPLNAGEVKLLNIKLEGMQQQETPGSYTLSYYADRKLGFSNHVDKSSLYIDIADFEPYNMIEVHGIEPGQLGIKGDVVMKTQGDMADTVSIKHMDVAKNAVNKLMGSPMFKPREIALAFLDKNYSKAYSLCDEYIKNPNDSQVTPEQVQFIKAECMRRLQNYDKYLSIVEAIDVGKLYPGELKSKLYHDRLAIYLEQQSQEKLKGLYKELEQDQAQSTQVLKQWIENSGAFSLTEAQYNSIFKQMKTEEGQSEQPSSIFEQTYKAAMNYPYTPLIIFAAGVLIGLTLRRIVIHRKRKRSMYIYRM